jgi:ABC-type multidrug transport system ATPase subunit
MKICSINIENNPILWESFNLNLCNNRWIPYETVLLVWENWSGKSTLLNVIYSFSDLLDDSLEYPNQKWIFEVLLSIADINLINSAWSPPAQIPPNSKCKISIDFRQQAWNRLTAEFMPSSIISNIRIWNVGKKILKSIFSDVSINFTSKNIDNVRDSDIDARVEWSMKSGEDISTQITQMLVDIYNRDAGDLNTWVKSNLWISPPNEQIEIRTKRFKNAFFKMFGNDLEYIWADWLKPTFKKWDNIIEINRLSSWEKQIVFRGSYLLKDQESIKWALVLIDEPELSLHPIWQRKILSYYRWLFSNEQWIQTSQIFITTHSPYVLQEFNWDTDWLFVFPWGRQLETLPKFLWLYPSLGVVTYYAYNLPTIEFHDELYWFIQTKAIDTDPNNSFEDSFERFLTYRWLLVSKKWTREKEWSIHPQSKYHNYDITLQTFIRNKIHHPENMTMSPIVFTFDELKLSIDDMIRFINDNSL